ncbi:MAG: hypothetical protein KGI58_03915 [Patescibacteria group bacterium]|nr:hypothetical protein [Patescibacteria group bacterium]
MKIYNPSTDEFEERDLTQDEYNNLVKQLGKQNFKLAVIEKILKLNDTDVMINIIEQLAKVN